VEAGPYTSWAATVLTYRNKCNYSAARLIIVTVDRRWDTQRAFISWICSWSALFRHRHDIG